MNRRITIPIFLFITVFILGLVTAQDKTKNQEVQISTMSKRNIKTDEEWQQCLTPEQYRILRQKGTEAAFTGEYYEFEGDGVYKCAGCGKHLFDSATKYHSGSGWPSFWASIDDGNIDKNEDTSHGKIRTEIVCSNCGAHLGHVFEDSPQPTGLRYCVNSASLQFSERAEETGHSERSAESPPMAGRISQRR